MFWLAGFTPEAAWIALLRRRGFSLASPDSGSIFKAKMLQSGIVPNFQQQSA